MSVTDNLKSLASWLAYKVLQLALFVVAPAVLKTASAGKRAFKRRNESHAAIRQRSQRYSKLPTHVCIALDEETVSLEHVASICEWCGAAGVTHLSLWDRHNVLRTHEKELAGLLEQSSGESVFYVRQVHPRSISNGNESTSKQREHASFLQQDRVAKGSTHGVSIVLLAPDARDIVAEGCLRLARAAQNEPSILDYRLCAKDFTKYLPEYLDEPELLLQFGPSFARVPALVWNCRVTEMLSFPTHLDFHAADVTAALYTYSKCEQRLGR